MKPSGSSAPFSYADGGAAPSGAGALLLLLALLAGGYRFELLRFLLPAGRLALPAGEPSGVDRRALHERRDPLPDELRALLAEAARRSAAGESIRFLPPAPEIGLSYAYYRAHHAWAGRRTLPPEADTRADWVAAWRRAETPTGYDEVWSAGTDARLLRRRR